MLLHSPQHMTALLSAGSGVDTDCVVWSVANKALYVCLSAFWSVSICLLVGLSACLPACLPAACLPVCLSVRPFNRPSVCACHSDISLLCLRTNASNAHLIRELAYARAQDVNHHCLCVCASHFDASLNTSNAHLISELAYARAQDCVNLHASNQIRMPRDDITQLQPQLVLGLSLQASEGVVIHHSCQLFGSFAPASLRHVKSIRDEYEAVLSWPTQAKQMLSHVNGKSHMCRQQSQL